MSDQVLLQEVSVAKGEVPEQFRLPKPGQTSVYASLLMVLVYMAISACWVWFDGVSPNHLIDGQDTLTLNQKVLYITCVLSFGMVCLIIAEFVYRLVLLVEELRHVKLRYDGSYVAAFKNTFYVPWLTYALFIIWVSVLLIASASGDSYRLVIASYFRQHCFIMVTQVVLNSGVLAMVGLRGPSKVELRQLSERTHMNVAHGLAWSFYLGYLKYVVPGLPNRVSEWSEKKQKPPVEPKLYILLPESCIAFSSLADGDSSVSFAGHINFEMSRAGNINRSYRQTIYKIPGKDRDYHCVVEYATPLLSLYEMSECPESGLSNQEKNQQLRIFYKTLTYILSLVPEVEENVVLVPYQDRDSDGSWVKISKVLRKYLH